MCASGRTLRALVNARLTAAAEEIFALFERTIAEYEEELRRCKETEKQKKEELLDSALSPRVELIRVETPHVKEEPEEPEEQSVKQEEEQLQVSVPVAVYVKNEESSLLQQRQTEHREETQEEDISSELHFHSETEGYTEHFSETNLDNLDEFWRATIRCSAAQMETEAEHYNQVHIRARSTASQNSSLCPQNKSVPETSATVDNGNMPGTAEGMKKKKHQCSFCKKRFGTKQHLQRHIRVHTGEKPYSCFICTKAFTQNIHLAVHMRIHTGEKPFSCSICKKSFTQSSSLKDHEKIHTGKKTYSCYSCNKEYMSKQALKVHIKIHTGEKTFSCSICMKPFARQDALDIHRRTHTDGRNQLFKL